MCWLWSLLWHPAPGHLHGYEIPLKVWHFGA